MQGATQSLLQNLKMKHSHCTTHNCLQNDVFIKSYFFSKCFIRQLFVLKDIIMLTLLQAGQLNKHDIGIQKKMKDAHIPTQSMHKWTHGSQMADSTLSSFRSHLNVPVWLGLSHLDCYLPMADANVIFIVVGRSVLIDRLIDSKQIIMVQSRS